MISPDTTIDELVKRLLTEHGKNGFQVFMRNGKVNISPDTANIHNHMGIIGMADTFEKAIRGVEVIQDEYFNKES